MNETPVELTPTYLPGAIAPSSERFLSARESPRPQDGDIVVACDSSFPAQWTVRQAPGPAQFGASSQGQSLQLARGFAQAHLVDLWIADEGSYRLIGRYRQPGERAQQRH